MKILLIEDDDFFSSDIKFILEDEGHEVDVIDDSDTVIDRIGTLKGYDIIILDIMMLAGDKALGKAKKIKNADKLDTGEILYKLIRKEHRDIRIIILTARDFGDMRINFESEKNTQTLSKPLDDRTLSNLIELIEQKKWD